MNALIAITGILLLAYCLLILYYRVLWQKVPLFNAPVPPPCKLRVSVIVAARNEEENILACLQSLLAQDYPPSDLEIIVVDDHSSDQTAEIVAGMSSPQISLIQLSALMMDRKNENPLAGIKPIGGKKEALEAGVAAASGELILATDADCTHPNTWVNTMAGFFLAHNPVFIAAPVRILPGTSWLGIFQSLDFLSLQGITAAAAHRGLHQMSNGANLGFAAAAFRSVGGYRNINHIATGDDMLLMQKLQEAFPGKNAYCLSSAALVDTKPCASFSAFLQQRIRWSSKARAYRDPSILPVLALVYAVNLLLFILGLMIPFFPFLLKTWLFFMLCKTLSELIFLYPVARFYRLISILPWFPLAQPLHLIYTVIAGFFGQVKKYTWKDRRWHS